MGTEAHSTTLSRAQTREDLLNSVRYRRSSGTLSERPPSRVELREKMLSPWASISYGGCRFLRVARAETIRKLRAINSYYAEHRDDNLANTVLNVEVSREQEDYVLFYLTMEDCMFQPRSVVGWADQPDHPHPIPNLGENASLQEWLDWADRHNRGVRASAMEWVLMDPSRGRMFSEFVQKPGVPIQVWRVIRFHHQRVGATRSEGRSHSELHPGEDQQGPRCPQG